MKQSHFMEVTAGFAEGGDAGGQAGGKARGTEAYRHHRGHKEKNHSNKGLSESNFREILQTGIKDSAVKKNHHPSVTQIA
jgi:hypothetical protein